MRKCAIILATNFRAVNAAAPRLPAVWAIDPKFIMLDEPFAGVDPIAVEDVQSVVYHSKEKDIGILITDHNAQETLRITDRAYLLFEGKILFQGTSEELAENPTVREKYLGRDFMFYRKKFRLPRQQITPGPLPIGPTSLTPERQISLSAPMKIRLPAFGTKSPGCFTVDSDNQNLNAVNKQSQDAG